MCECFCCSIPTNCTTRSCPASNPWPLRSWRSYIWINAQLHSHDGEWRAGLREHRQGRHDYNFLCLAHQLIIKLHNINQQLPSSSYMFTASCLCQMAQFKKLQFLQLKTVIWGIDGIQRCMYCVYSVRTSLNTNGSAVVGLHPGCVSCFTTTHTPHILSSLLLRRSHLNMVIMWAKTDELRSCVHARNEEEREREQDGGREEKKKIILRGFGFPNHHHPSSSSLSYSLTLGPPPFSLSFHQSFQEISRGKWWK